MQRIIAKVLLLIAAVGLALAAARITTALRTRPQRRDQAKAGSETRKPKVKTAKGTGRSTPADAVDTKLSLDLIAEGENAERGEKWDEALERYEMSLMLLDRMETRAKVRAVRHIQTAIEFEREQKWPRALDAYQLASVDCSHKDFVQARMKYCGKMEPYAKAYEEGKRLEAASAWEDALAAFAKAQEHAAAAGIESDVAQRIKNLWARLEQGQAQALVQGRKQQLRDGAQKLGLEKRMDRLLRVLAEQEKHRAVLLACEFYADSADHAGFARAIKAARALAAEAREADRAAHPIERGSRTFDCLTRKDGRKHRGKLLGKDARTYTFRVMDGPIQATLRLAAKDVAAVEQRTLSARQVLDAQALAILGEALDLLKDHRALEAAELIGRLCLDYFDAPLLRDEIRQKDIFEQRAPGCVEQVGHSLSQARRRIVPIAEERADFIEHRCPECNGEGLAPCPTCRGKGTVGRRCDQCAGRGQVTCTRCGGEGMSRCGRCRGKGYRTKKKSIVSGKGKKTVSYKVPCRSCGGRGLVKCKRCKGRSRCACPKCKGTGSMPVPCPQCQGKKKIECHKCKGQGRLPGED